LKQDTLQDYQERMLQVLVHIQNNLDQGPTLEELAELAHFSPFHLHRIFRGMVGESLKAHVRRLRLERAATRLCRTTDSILRIALNSGFDSHAAFSRAFKSQLGYTPSEWRTIPQADLPYSKSPVGSEVFSNPQGDRKREVKIVKTENMRVAFVRHSGPYDQCSTAWGKLCMHLGPLGLLGGSPQFIGLSYDDPEVTSPDNIRYDACVAVDEKFKPEGEIGVQTLKGGTFACTTHYGPYENFNRTYSELLGQWLPRSNRRVKSDPTRELYLNDPENTEPEDLVTDIFVALEESS